MFEILKFTLFYQEKKPYLDKAAELKAEYVKSMESVNGDDAGNIENAENDDGDKVEEVSCKGLSFSVMNGQDSFFILLMHHLKPCNVQDQDGPSEKEVKEENLDDEDA